MRVLLLRTSMWRVGFVALFTLLATGCAQIEWLVSADDVLFELTARMAVRWRDESVSGNVAWRHRQKNSEMVFTSALGSTIARLIEDPSGVQLTAADGTVHQARDAATLTQSILGFPVPLSALSDWVRARPSPSSEAVVERDAYGRPTALTQAGWRIEYSAYDNQGRPLRLRVSRPEIELRLAISEWKR
jgi:outer membrane lipoprotein LolB